MNFVDFRHRSARPDIPVKGSFYWIDGSSSEIELLFAPDDNPDHLILLNRDLTQKVSKLEERMNSNDVSITEIKKSLAGIIKSALTQNDLKDYVKKSDLNDYIRYSDLDGIGDDDISLEDYVKKDELEENYALKKDIPSVPENVSELKNDAGYITAGSLDGYVKDSSLSGYAKKSDLNDYIKYSDLDGVGDDDYDIKEYAKKSDVDEKLESYALKKDIPEVPENVSAFTNDAGYLTEHQSLEEYAKKTDIPDVSNLASKDEIPSLEGYAKISDIPKKVSDLDDAENYINKEELDNYATLGDLEGYVESSELNEKLSTKADVLSWIIKE